MQFAGTLSTGKYGNFLLKPGTGTVSNSAAAQPVSAGEAQIYGTEEISDENGVLMIVANATFLNDTLCDKAVLEFDFIVSTNSTESEGAGIVDIFGSGLELWRLNTNGNPEEAKVKMSGGGNELCYTQNMENMRLRSISMNPDGELVRVQLVSPNTSFGDLVIFSVTNDPLSDTPDIRAFAIEVPLAARNN